MVAVCIRHAKIIFLCIPGALISNQITYHFDEFLNPTIQQEIKNTIQKMFKQKKDSAYITHTIPTQYPCVQSVTIEHLPDNNEQINVVSIEPHIAICLNNNNYLIDTQGHCISSDHFKQEKYHVLPMAYATKKSILDHWDTHLTHAIIYWAATHPNSRIEIDNAHAIRVKPNTEAPITIVSDAYQLPTPKQLALCAQRIEEHKNSSAGHLKKCKKLTLDMRFYQQIIQRCTLRDVPSLVTIGGTSHGSYTT